MNYFATSPLTDHNLAVRILSSYAVFVVLLSVTYIFGLYVLPEGALKDFPLVANVALGKEHTFVTQVLKTIAFNLMLVSMIIVANMFRVRSLPFGYLPIWANTAIMGLMAGSNSFSGSISSRTTYGWTMFLKIGFLEFSSYILACAATVGLTMFYADRWRGTRFRKVMRLKELKLTKSEVYLLILSLVLLILAAFNEWAAGTD